MSTQTARARPDASRKSNLKELRAKNLRRHQKSVVHYFIFFMDYNVSFLLQQQLCCGISDQNLVMHLSHISHAECEETFVTQVFPAPVSSCANLRDSVCCTSSCDFRQFHSMSIYCYSTWPKGEPPLRPGSILLTANEVWWLDQTAFAHNLSKPLLLNWNGWLKKSSEMVVILYFMNGLGYG